MGGSVHLLSNDESLGTLEITDIISKLRWYSKMAEYFLFVTLGSLSGLIFSPIMATEQTKDIVTYPHMFLLFGPAVIISICAYFVTHKARSDLLILSRYILKNDRVFRVVTDHREILLYEQVLSQMESERAIIFYTVRNAYRKYRNLDA